MTEANNSFTCDPCDPVRKYDIAEDIRDLVDNITDNQLQLLEVEDLIPVDPFRFQETAGVGEELGPDSPVFTIPNPNQEKIDASIQGKKPDNFVTPEITDGYVPADSSSLALIERGRVVPPSSFIDVTFDSDKDKLNEITKTLFCIPDKMPEVSDDVLSKFNSRAREYARITGITFEMAKSVFVKILRSPYKIREELNRITNANIPETQIITDVSVNCLIRKESKRTIPLDNGPDAVAITSIGNPYVQNFVDDTVLTLLTPVIYSYTVEDRIITPQYSSIINSADHTMNKFNNPQNALNEVNDCFTELLQAVIQLVASIVDYGQGGKTEHEDQIQRLPSVKESLDNFVEVLTRCIQDLISLQIPKLNDVINLANDIKSKSVFSKKYIEELIPSNNLAQSNPLFGDITKMLETIKSKIESIIEKIQEMLGKIGDFSFSGANPDEYIENRDQGSMLGNFLSALVLGQGIPTQKQSNNPMLKDPSYIGKALFGETPISLPAFDQEFSKKVAMFEVPEGGAGASAFQMLSGQMGGNQTLGNAVSKLMTNVSFNNLSVKNKTMIENISNDVAGLLGSNININTNIDLKKTDNAIPLMIGMSARISGDTYSPFPTKVFSEAWKNASFAMTRIQKINKDLLTELSNT